MSPPDEISVDQDRDEWLEQMRGARRVELPIPSLRQGVAMRLAEQVAHDATLTDEQKMAAYRDLPRNRREARQLLKGRGPWGIAKRNG